MKRSICIFSIWHVHYIIIYNNFVKIEICAIYVCFFHTGKCGLSYRSHRFEAIHNLENENIKDGNFWDILALLGKYNSVLSGHMNEYIAKSKANNSLKRGNFLSLYM